MAMTTTVEKILAKAQEFEDNARALRLAASLLNGHVRETKIATMEATLAGAVKLRREQKGGRVASTEDDRAARKAAIIAFLQGGPRSAADIYYQLQAQGRQVNPSLVRHQLLAMSEVVSQGRGRQARWTLALPPLPPRRRAPRPLTPIESRPKKRTQYQRTQELKPARREKALQVVTLLKEAGRPLSTKELTAAAREVGIRSLTGIVAYVRKGWIKRTGRQKGNFKYSFLQLPPDVEGEAAPTES